VRGLPQRRDGGEESGPGAQGPGDQTVLAKINEGGGGMPSYKDMLSDEEKANVLAYLKTL
jgi:mono/diheme cytochrome c family protein